MNIPVKVNDRIITGIKKYRPIVEQAKCKDVNESDTVTIITDILHDIFGFDKYAEITSEFAIKRTFCDLAIKIDGHTRLLIEVKAAGMELKENHVRQAAGYGSLSGVDWVILTNGSIWFIYKIIFSKPVDLELVYQFDLLDFNVKKQSDLELIYYLSKESLSKVNMSSLDDYHTQKQLVNKISIGQILLTDSVLDAIKKTIKKVSPDAKPTNEEIKDILERDIIKREVLSDVKCDDLKKKITKATKPAKPIKKTHESETLKE